MTAPETPLPLTNATDLGQVDDPGGLPTPIFIFSITRSGSTLLQRVIGSHPGVATASEPWLLIPLLYTLRSQGVAAEYTHPFAVEAIGDFSRQLPRGVDDYRDELRRFVLRLYAKAAGGGGARYFLDKTPPYFFVIDEIVELFPQAKCILLFRNPLMVLASLIDYDDGVWDPAHYRENLFDGLAKLARARERYPDRFCAVRYEELVTGDHDPWRRLMAYLEMEFDPDSLTRFSALRLQGRMGDPFGVKRYTTLSREPLEKWRTRINNPIRKAWADRWLRWLGAERLAIMGYDLDELRAQLRAVPTDNSALPADCRRLARALLREPVRAKARRMAGLGGPSSFRYILDLES